MPQMSPMNWTLLFIIFTMIFIILNTNNYFFIKYYFSSKIKNLKLSKLNWKW